MGRVIRLPGGRRIEYDELSDEARVEVDGFLREWAELVERNPLQGFDPFPKQREFLAAGRVKHKMALAGNRAGKTEIGVVDDLIQCVDRECLPSWLECFKVWEPPFYLRVVVGDLSNTLEKVMLEKWRKLTPRGQLVGESFESAYDKSLRVLNFKNGSWVQFMSSDQDREKHAGAMLDRVHFDEEPPPPNGFGIYQENRRRLIDRRGQLMFTMTPLLGLSWTYDEIWARRDEPPFTVVQWSMLDNLHLPKEEVELELSLIRSEKERQAVINGDFVHFRGRVLEELDEARHVVDPPSREELRGWDVVLGYDPGLSRSAVVFVAFDADNEMLVFDELYLSGTPLAYFDTDAQGNPTYRPSLPEEQPSIVELVSEKCRWWGVEPLCWVIDPSARIRDMTSARESVQSALLRAGVSVVPGENDRLSGILELKRRLESDALRVSRACVNWLHEADRWLVAMDEEALEMRAKGTAKGSSFTTIGPDHLMDVSRYIAMFRVWGAGRVPPEAPERRWTPGEAIPARFLTPRVEVGPMGFMS